MNGIKMRRVLSLLLIPLLLASQGLCFVHTHQGTHTGEPDGHSSRPHFHVHGVAEHHHHHADHSHRHDAGDDHEEPAVPAIEPVADHDADAVYCSETVVIGTGRQSRSELTLKQLIAASFWQSPATLDIDPLNRGNLSVHPPPLCATRCPIYLRTLSIRI